MPIMFSIPGPSSGLGPPRFSEDGDEAARSPATELFYRLPTASGRTHPTQEILHKPFEPASRFGKSSKVTGLGVQSTASQAAKEPAASDKISQGTCPPEKRKFFETLDAKISASAKRLGMDADLLMTLVAHESAWYGEHAQELNNIFGLTRAGGRNLSFSSIDKCIEYWEKNTGPKIKGSKDMEEFLVNLHKPPNYNKADPKYDEKMRAIYKSILKFRKNCGFEKNENI
jgi:hypothetical protein